jgi:chromosome segregation ATPase
MNIQSERVGASPASQFDAMEESEDSIASFLERDRARIWALGSRLYVFLIQQGDRFANRDPSSRPPDFNNSARHDIPNPILNHPPRKLFNPSLSSQPFNKRKLPYTFRQILNKAEDEGSYKRSKPGDAHDAFQLKEEQLRIANLQLGGKDQLLREAKSELRQKMAQLCERDSLLDAHERELRYLRTQLTRADLKLANQAELQDQKYRVEELEEKNNDLETCNTRLVDQAIASAETIGELTARIAGLEAENLHLLDTKIDVEEKLNGEKTTLEVRESPLTEQPIQNPDAEEERNSLEKIVVRLPPKDSSSLQTIRQLREKIADFKTEHQLLLERKEDLLKNWYRHEMKLKDLEQEVIAQDEDGSVAYEDSEDECISPPDLEDEYQLLLERKTDLEKKAYLLSVKLREKDKSLLFKDVELLELKEEILGLKRALVQKDEALAEKDAQLSELNETITSLNAQLQEKDASLAEKDTQLLNKVFITETLTNSNLDLESQLANCQESLAQANIDLEDRDTELTEMNEFLLSTGALLADTQSSLDNRISIITVKQMNETTKNRLIKSSKEHRLEKDKLFNEKKAALKAEITKRSKALENRDAELRDKDKIIAKKDEELAETRRLLVKAENKVVKRTSKFEMELATKDIEVETLTAWVAELEQSLAFSALLDMRRRLAERETELSQRISGLEADLMAKSRLLETNASRLTELETSLAAKVIELRGETALVAEKIGQLSHLEREKLKLTEELDKHKRSSKLEIAQLTDNDKQLRRQMDHQLAEKERIIRQLRERLRVLESQNSELPIENDGTSDTGETAKKPEPDHFGRQRPKRGIVKITRPATTAEKIVSVCYPMCVIVALAMVATPFCVAYMPDSYVAQFKTWVIEDYIETGLMWWDVLEFCQSILEIMWRFFVGSSLAAW